MQKFVSIRDQLIDYQSRSDRMKDFYGQDAGADRLLLMMTKIIPKIMKAEVCSLFVYEPKGDKVWLKCANNLTERMIEVPRVGSMVGHVISTGESQIRTNMDQEQGIHKETDKATHFVTRDILCVPIRSAVSGRVTGAVQVINKQDGVFGEEDQLYLEELAGYCDAAMENIFFNQQMMEMLNKVQKKVDVMAIFLRLWGGFLLVFAAAIIMMFTPHVVSIFSR